MSRSRKRSSAGKACGLTRRDLLAGFVGLPAAWAAGGCGVGSQRALEGEIVGASDQAGHRLRDGFRPRPPESRARPESRPREVQVVIVGAGIAGLSAAWRL